MYFPPGMEQKRMPLTVPLREINNLVKKERQILSSVQVWEAGPGRRVSSAPCLKMKSVPVLFPPDLCTDYTEACSLASAWDHHLQGLYCFRPCLSRKVWPLFLHWVNLSLLQSSTNLIRHCCCFPKALASKPSGTHATTVFPFSVISFNRQCCRFSGILLYK